MLIDFILFLVPEDSAAEFTAPEFVEQLKDVKIKDGQPLALKVSVTGDPEPKVEWFKNNTPLSSSDIMDLKYKNRVATLNIGEVYPEDEGEYMCKATNSQGTVRTKCKLTVIGKLINVCLNYN